MRVVVGIGARAGAQPGDIVRAVQACVDPVWTVLTLATVTHKRDVVTAAASDMGVEVVTFTPDRLAAVNVPNPSERVLEATGSASIAEAAALLGAGGGPLIVHKVSSGAVTVAIAEALRD